MSELNLAKSPRHCHAGERSPVRIEHARTGRDETHVRIDGMAADDLDAFAVKYLDLTKELELGARVGVAVFGMLHLIAGPTHSRREAAQQGGHVLQPTRLFVILQPERRRTLAIAQRDAQLGAVACAGGTSHPVAG